MQQVQSQQSCNNNRQCSTNCQSIASDNNCCNLRTDEPLGQTLESNTPLGFILYTLPGTESNIGPPCMRVPFPDTSVGQDGVYLVVAVSV